LKHPIPSSKTSSYYYRLIPIDHGLCFPDCFEICNYEMVWMDWPQVKEPLSNKTLEFINSIEPKKDLELLCSKLELRRKCLQNFYLAEILLKIAAKKGFTLFEIGNMIYKDDEDDNKNTDIKNLIEKTKYIYKILKSTNNKTLDSWVRRSIHILKEKKLKKEQKKIQRPINSAVDEPIIEEENEEEVKKNTDEIKRRRSFSDNYSLIDEENPPNNNCRINTVKINQIQSPGLNSNSTEDDHYLHEPLKIKKNISSVKFANNEMKIIQKSPENLALKRSLSLPYFKKNDSKGSKTTDDLDLDGSFLLENPGNNGKKNQWKNKKTKSLKPEDIFDDIFIYYYESFVNQLLDLKLNEKKRAKHIFRNRVLSTEVTSLK